ncbi:hypothetical protein [Labedella endophytica]|uniref:Glycosyltransferase RgtA/B/C/D-like domain-containing protein n=1 Tax=Labedella endophytica TaxID=1523160 RepID=A0A433JRG0_9MICO|nr:hypothetical protein [Labedella endophytica]RUQ99246.1 hypothetical protein ELQ94_13150 [Labedella endophytica]
MADGLTATASGPQIADGPDRFGRLPWWVAVLGIFAIARVMTTGMLLFLASIQTQIRWAPASPDLLRFSARWWDGGWYRQIAEGGYPTVIEPEANGHIGQNEWAFMPVYPGVVRELMTVTGLDWSAASVLVSVVAGSGAALVVYLLFREMLDKGTTLFAVVLFSISPLAAMFQVAYAESLHLLLLATALLLVLRRRYLVLIPIIVVMGFTRPSGLAFALFLGLHILLRLYTRRSDPFPLKESLSAGVTTFVSLCVGVAWLVIAGLATGDMATYTDTELSWRAPYIGYQHLIPFTPWFQSLNYRVGEPWGWMFVTVVIIGFIATMFLPQVRRLGTDIRLWSLSYALYLFAVFFPQSSTFRLLLPVFPLAGALAIPRSRVYRVLVVLGSLIGQFVWLYLFWRLGDPSPLPP